jgi:hypothetical protein
VLSDRVVMTSPSFDQHGAEAPYHSLNGYQKACRNRRSLLGNSNLEHVCQR